MFNQSYLGSSEGFTSQPATMPDTTAAATDAAADADKMSADAAAGDKKPKPSTVTTTVSSAVSTPTPTTSTGETFVGGREGFNITEREGTLLRGKRSNEVPVFSNARSQSDNVAPADKSVLSGGLFSSA